MSYRPQYAYPPAPAGFRYEQFHYSFDSTNVVAFQGTLAAGAQTDAINLQTEQDAIFKCRAVRFALGTGDSRLYCELRTPHGDYLQSPFVPLARWARPTGIVGAGRCSSLSNRRLKRLLGEPGRCTTTIRRALRLRSLRSRWMG